MTTNGEPDQPEETDDSGVGEQLGPFRVGNRLGVGGMGIVFQALDTQLNRQVALKVISPHIGDNPEFRARFAREARAQASLDSPHVVQIYSFGEADGRLYIASQLIPDGDLGQMLTRHGCPPARVAVHLMSQVAEGLADAHAAGLIHRDIKPANVLLRNRENHLHAYLGDFGIARHLDAEAGLTRAGSTVGTPSYMAPELHLGNTAGQTGDVYSLGCLVWTTLTGRPPYAGSGTDYQLMMAHVEQPVPQLAPTGPLAAEINRVLRTAMAKSPGDRYPSAAAMREDLRSVVRLPDDPTPVRPAGTEPGPPPAPVWAHHPPHTPAPASAAPGTPMAPMAQVSQAPPAPPFRPPPPAPPQFSTLPTANYHQEDGRGPRGGKAGWVLAAVIVLVLVAVAVVAAVVVVRGRDDPTGGSPAPVSPAVSGPASGSSSASEPSGSPSASASPPAPAVDSGDGGDARQTKAVDTLTTAFTDNGSTDPAAAGCFARQLVESIGVDRLVELGVLTEDLEVNQADGDPGATSEVVAGIQSATLACIGELTSPTPSSSPSP